MKAPGGCSETQSAGAPCYPAAMRKTTFVRPFSCGVSLFCLAALGLACLAAFAQDAGSATVPAKDAPAPAANMPTDPKALMLLAAKSNGLTGDDVKPWHLKASFKLLDEKGNTTDQGTYEEFWASPTKYKRSFASAAFVQTDYGTEKGVLRTGARDSAPGLLTRIRNEVISPIPLDQEWIERSTKDPRKRKPGATGLLCFTETGTTGPVPGQRFIGSTYCLDADRPILRMVLSTWGYGRSLRNNIVKFQDHYLPEDLEDFGENASPKAGSILTAHLDLLETLRTINEADFAPPPDALPLPKRIELAENVTKKMLLQNPAPIYPPIAKAARVSGTVVLQAIIRTDGHLESVHVISGPAMLQQAAIDSVNKRTYKPFLVDGEPVQVSTMINVTFNLPG